MTSTSLAGKIIKITLITLTVLFVLLFLTMFSAMKDRNSIMPGAWWDGEDAMMDTSFATTASDSFGGARNMMMYDYALESATPAPENAAVPEPRVIKTGSIDMTAEHVSDAVSNISTLATTLGGFVQSSERSENEVGATTAYITIRIPSDTFDSAMTDIKALGVHVNNESTSGEDVTAQYVDIEARLSAAQAQEAQYLIILEDATTVGEVLAVQEHLAVTRSEIESLQGQLTYLTDRTDLSTISVSISEETTVGSIGDTKFDPIRDANSAIDFVVTLGQQLVSAVIWIFIVGIAIGIPVGIIWLIVRFFMNRTSDAKRRK